MTAKEFLQQAYIAHGEVEMKLEQITRLQSLATRTTSTISTTLGNKNGESESKIERAIISMEGQIEKLSEEITKLLEVVKEVSEAISQVANPTERKILEYRYLCFFSWKQISLLMKVSQRTIYSFHNAALKNFAVVCSNLQ